MIVAGIYSFNDGEAIVKRDHPTELQEVFDAITSINSGTHKTKSSREKTMPGRILYSPSSLNSAFKAYLGPQGWIHQTVKCDYDDTYYTSDYRPFKKKRQAFRDMDFIKNKVGVEVQFGKYAFMVYNVCAKMTIFHKMGYIDVGIEVVPVRDFASEMSTGVSYFEQFVWDLKQRGISNIDIPVLIVGIA